MTLRTLCCTLVFFLSVNSALTRADVAEESFAFDHEQVAALNPAPGTVITKDNVESFSHILAPKLVDLISEEFLTITTAEPISMSTHPAYIEATRRYLDQTELGDQPGIIHNYVAGRPFPGNRNSMTPGQGTSWPGTCAIPILTTAARWRAFTGSTGTCGMKKSRESCPSMPVR